MTHGTAGSDIPIDQVIWKIWKDQHPSGPYSVNELQGLFAAGEIDSDTLICLSQENEWRPIAKSSVARHFWRPSMTRVPLGPPPDNEFSETQRFIAIGGAFAIVVIVFFAALVMNSPPSTAETPPPSPDAVATAQYTELELVSAAEATRYERLIQQTNAKLLDAMEDFKRIEGHYHRVLDASQAARATNAASERRAKDLLDAYKRLDEAKIDARYSNRQISQSQRMAAMMALERNYEDRMENIRLRNATNSGAILDLVTPEDEQQMKACKDRLDELSQINRLNNGRYQRHIALADGAYTNDEVVAFTGGILNHYKLTELK